MVKIAVDTAGGDHGAGTTVYGTCLAMREDPELECLLFGEPKQIEDALPDFADTERIEIIAADEVITDDDDPLRAVRRKKDSTIVKGLKAVAEGEADAFVSAGSSGAIYAGGLFLIGKKPEITRPAAVSILPTVSENSPYYMLIDSGANITAKPEHLVEYARLGSRMAEQFLNNRNPRVGLLNIGSEPSKGNAFSKEVFQMLAAEDDLNFTGNVEPSVLLNSTHDIVLADGFTGNIMLKSVEGTAEILLNDLLNNVKKDEQLDEDAVQVIEKAVDARIKRYTNVDIGGGFILGINAPVVITHGAADEVMFKHSVEMAARLTNNSIFNDQQ
ncbi:phosphate acyltransferase PlsX [Salinicoccus halitifaciens]|uniref:Phosphate acyltransferase n=1 Tax=Salinicoccus halitifaciens TaxID=1073415 RepID=A0ABV2E8A1_9STAP|nr:phosphate acyltransferase PlsX [Salinicoccus halitifaciens]MCD2137781.1 phosphate acyltransferase PlsX [Salinicoccus halitifaciens]